MDGIRAEAARKISMLALQITGTTVDRIAKALRDHGLSIIDLFDGELITLPNKPDA